MAIYGIGACRNAKTDISADCIANNIIGVCWNAAIAPDLHEYIKTLKAGDIVYIKSVPPNQDITVKAVGIICDSVIVTSLSSNGLVEIGRNVKWVNTTQFVVKRPKEKNNVRYNTLYEELHPDVQKEILARF